MTLNLRNACASLLATALITAASAGLLVIRVPAASQEKNRALQDDNSAPAKNDTLVYAEIAKAPRAARNRRNPLENDPNAVMAGSKLFAQHCAECHGDNAEGGKRGPGLHDNQVQRAAPGALFWVLSNGVVRRGMPVWSKLPEPQRWQIVSFLKSLRTESSARAPGIAD